MLGTDACRLLKQRGHEVIATGRKEGLVSLDVCDTAQTRAVLTAHRPDAILHCAAWTNVDGAEYDPLGAYRGNALSTWNIAAASGTIDAWVVSVSTDFVFDGAKTTPYTEYDRVNPLGVYGASKEAGEQLIRQTLPDRHIIARTSWLFGKHGKCFPKTVVRLAETKPEVPIVADQMGCPTYTVDLANKLIDLMEDPLPGTYHVCNDGSCSWFEFAQEIVRQSGLSTPVVPITAEEYTARFNSPTKRPAYSVMQRLALELRGKDDLRPWQEALTDFLTP
jgi:dTDP-4-dehydrorhamnose reductase